MIKWQLKRVNFVPKEVKVSAVHVNKSFQEQHFMQVLKFSVAQWRKNVKQTIKNPFRINKILDVMKLKLPYEIFKP